MFWIRSNLECQQSLGGKSVALRIAYKCSEIAGYAGLAGAISLFFHSTMRKLFFCLAVTTSLLVKTSVLADEVCPTCDREVLITGEFKHRLADNGLFITNAPPSQQTSYRDELAGRQFSVICPRLPAGQYTVVLGFAETGCAQAGERVFGVTCGSHQTHPHQSPIQRQPWQKFRG
jgi:Malectin domain